MIYGQNCMFVWIRFALWKSKEESEIKLFSICHRSENKKPQNSKRPEIGSGWRITMGIWCLSLIFLKYSCVRKGIRCERCTAREFAKYYDYHVVRTSYLHSSKNIRIIQKLFSCTHCNRYGLYETRYLGYRLFIIERDSSKKTNLAIRENVFIKISGAHCGKGDGSYRHEHSGDLNHPN